MQVDAQGGGGGARTFKANQTYTSKNIETKKLFVMLLFCILFIEMSTSRVKSMSKKILFMINNLRELINNAPSRVITFFWQMLLSKLNK